MADTIELYPTRQKAENAYGPTWLEYRWRYRAENGNILGDSGESYHNKREALNGIYRIILGVSLPDWMHTLDVRYIGHAEVVWLDENGNVRSFPDPSDTTTENA